MNEVKRFELRVDRSGDGERIDRYVSRHISSITRSQVKRLVEKGCIRVDGKRPKTNEKLRQGQVVVVEVPVRRRGLKPCSMELKVLYEDEWLVAVDKPPGIVVHPSETVDEPTLVEALIAEFPQMRDVGERERPGLVHRLDKDTSGVLLVAKDVDVQRSLMSLFASHRVKKHYVALTSGCPKDDRGKVDVCIKRHPVHRQRYTVGEDGRRSLTSFRTLRRFGGRFAYLFLNPLTGRTHQVRVHLKHLGCPVLCDRLYSSRENLFISELYGRKVGKAEKPILTRQALHSFSVLFVHPVTGRYLRIKSPLPEDIRRVLDALEVAFPR